MSKLAIALGIGITAASIIGGTCMVANRRKKQRQHDILAEREMNLALTS